MYKDELFEKIAEVIVLNEEEQKNDTCKSFMEQHAKYLECKKEMERLRNNLADLVCFHYSIDELIGKYNIKTE